MDIECADAVGRLFESLPDIPEWERDVVSTRLTSVLGTAEAGADRAETLDTSLFLAGFLGSLLVTITTAVNLAGYITPAAASAVSTAVLVLSSLGTAAMGLRERLKFRERAVMLRRTSSALQRAAFLFLAHAGPYEHCPSPMAAYRAFVRDVEAIKGNADATSLQLRSASDDNGTLPPAPAAAGRSPSAAEVTPVHGPTELPQPREETPSSLPAAQV